MRALVFDGPWQLRVEERPDPEARSNEALLRILATGICGSDIHGYSGETGRRSPGQIMGHETVAEVLEDRTGSVAAGTLVTVNPLIGCGSCEACSRGTRQRCAARRVIGVDPDISSAFAERMSAPSDRLVPLPEGIPTRLGALIEPLAVGYHAARRGDVVSDDAVLVIGAGPIGQAVALACRRLGARDVVVAEINPDRRRLVEQLGFTVIDPTSSDASAIRAMLGRSPTVAIDAVAATTTLGSAIASVEVGGRIVMVGLAAPRVELPAFDITTAERSILGSFGYDDAAFEETAGWIAGREDELLQLIDQEVDLEQAPQAFEDLASGRSTASKILVRFT